jgi:hypothetical protein
MRRLLDEEIFVVNIGDKRSPAPRTELRRPEF